MEKRSRKRPGRYVETSQFLRAVARLVSAAGTRVADADPEDLRELVELGRQVDQAIVRAVAGLRDQGVTWEQIGEVCGTTRQAALMRWNPKIESLRGERPDGPGAGAARAIAG